MGKMARGRRNGFENWRNATVLRKTLQCDGIEHCVLFIFQSDSVRQRPTMAFEWPIQEWQGGTLPSLPRGSYLLHSWIAVALQHWPRVYLFRPHLKEGVLEESTVSQRRRRRNPSKKVSKSTVRHCGANGCLQCSRTH